MKDVKAYIESGILEQYLLGGLDDAGRREVEKLSTENPEIHAELEALEVLLENMAGKNSRPSAHLKKGVMDAIARIEAEKRQDLSRPPVLHEGSKPEEFKPWLDNPELVPPDEFDNIFYIPLAQNEDGLTALVWMKEGSPKEVHTDEIEKFLILEGACTIEIQGEFHKLRAGDYLSIPLHLHHEVTVTSEETCVILLQRIAA